MEFSWHNRARESMPFLPSTASIVTEGAMRRDRNHRLPEDPAERRYPVCGLSRIRTCAWPLQLNRHSARLRLGCAISRTLPVHCRPRRRGRFHHPLEFAVLHERLGRPDTPSPELLPRCPPQRSGSYAALCPFRSARRGNLACHRISNGLGEYRSSPRCGVRPTLPLPTGESCKLAGTYEDSDVSHRLPLSAKLSHVREFSSSPIERTPQREDHHSSCDATSCRVLKNRSSDAEYCRRNRRTASVFGKADELASQNRQTGLVENLVQPAFPSCMEGC